MGSVLEVRDLSTFFFLREGVIKAVNEVSFTLREGEILAVVGESGCGKSTLALSLLGLVTPPGRIVSGQVLLDGEDLVSLGEREMRRIRGKDISIVFQDPRSALNPVMSIGDQMEEIYLAHTNLKRKEARRLAVQMLKETGMPDPDRVLRRYPFQLSGGMCQRVMLSIALALRPRVLVADEPTSSLDATLQAEMLHRLRELTSRYGSAIVFITHDIGVALRLASKILVMYAGRVMEVGDASRVLERPLHPYTWGLLQAVPRLDADVRLVPLKGSPPDMLSLPEQCPYLPRCPKALTRCRVEPHPPLREAELEHLVACYNPVSHD